MTVLIVLLALAAMASVGLDLLLRAEHHVQTSHDRIESGHPYPLEGLSHRLLPQLENAPAYRAIAIAIILVAATGGAAVLIETPGAVQ